MLGYTVELLEEKRAQLAFTTSHFGIGPHWNEDMESQESVTPIYQQTLCLVHASFRASCLRALQELPCEPLVACAPALPVRGLSLTLSLDGFSLKEQLFQTLALSLNGSLYVFSLYPALTPSYLPLKSVCQHNLSSYRGTNHQAVFQYVQAARWPCICLARLCGVRLGPCHESVHPAPRPQHASRMRSGS